MFIVFVLLLDDALKPVTPLTNGTINQNAATVCPTQCSRIVVNCQY